MTEQTFAHPLDEPCPPGCPTRNAEIASTVNGWASAYTDDLGLTTDDVTRALAKPKQGWPANSIEYRIHQYAENWK